MEFAGREIPLDAEQRASEIFARIVVLDELGLNSSDYDELKNTISTLAEEDLDAATALFILACDSDAESFRSKLAPKLAMYCRKVDPEIGNRLLHSLLTSFEGVVRHETFTLISNSYTAGNLSFEEYMPFYLTHELEATRAARFRNI